MISVKSVQSLYKKYNVHHSKRFGQNFLIDNNVIQKIVSHSDASGMDVIEIGPGLGSLTLALLPIAKNVTSYEIDKDMIKVLEGEVSAKNFTLKHEDFLKADFLFKAKKVIVANIPYNITSDIIFKILRNSDKFISATLMVQKEVANRIVAKLGDKEYGKLAVSIASIAKSEKIMDISPDKFVPQPKVDSSVIKLTFNDKYDFEFLEFIKKSFAFRRKTLMNNWKHLMSKEKIVDIFSQVNICEKSRPENISLDKFKNAFNIYKNK